MFSTTRTLLASLLVAASFSAGAVTLPYDFSAPGTRNASIGETASFSSSAGATTALGVTVSSYTVADSGTGNLLREAGSTTLEVHRNRINGLGATGGRSDPYANRLNVRNDGSFEVLEFVFDQVVSLQTLSLRAIGANSDWMLGIDGRTPLTAPIGRAVAGTFTVDLAALDLEGRTFRFAVAGVGQSYRVRGFGVAPVEASAPATGLLALGGLLFAAARRRRNVHGAA